MGTSQAPADIEKVIERVRKMFNKAESCKDIGSFEEAAAFSEAVIKTLAAHKLDMSVLNVQQQDRLDPMGRTHFSPVENARNKQKRIWWIEELAQSVAHAYFCRLLVIPGSDRLVVVGREQDREVAVYMVVMLTRLANELCQQGYWKARYVAFKETGSYDTKDFKESFYRAFVDRIRSRFIELRQAQKADTGTGMSLVVSRSNEELSKYMDEVVKPKHSAAVTKYHYGSNSDGHHAGRTAADAANLTGKAVRTPAPAKSVGGPTKQIRGS